MMGRLLRFLFFGPSISHVLGGCCVPCTVLSMGIFAAWDRIVMPITGICPVSSQGMPLGSTEWQDSLYFASANFLWNILLKSGALEGQEI